MKQRGLACDAVTLSILPVYAVSAAVHRQFLGCDAWRTDMPKLDTKLRNTKIVKLENLDVVCSEATCRCCVMTSAALQV